VLYYIHCCFTHAGRSLMMYSQIFSSGTQGRLGASSLCSNMLVCVSGLWGKGASRGMGTKICRSGSSQSPFPDTTVWGALAHARNDPSRERSTQSRSGQKNEYYFVVCGTTILSKILSITVSRCIWLEGGCHSRTEVPAA